jgi:ribosomal protein S12 methylthiotransferase
MQKKSIYLISLGCAKNTVDSESMIRILRNAGYIQVDKLEKASHIIINTCGFIQSARQESIEVLRDVVTQKSEQQILIAAGCMMERNATWTIENVPGINGIIGTRRWMEIVQLLKKIHRNNQSGTISLDNNLPKYPSCVEPVPRIAIQGSSAYLKIADGCHRKCAFCSIPLIKGTIISRQEEEILKDVEYLTTKKIKEIIIIAQDSTSYGIDLGITDGLTGLLEKIAIIAPDIPWIRVMYTFPGIQAEKFVDSLHQNHRVLPYLDLPLQHAHPIVLRRMKRPANVENLANWLKKIRSRIPTLVLRSTFIVGYPGETDKEFQFLLDFVHEMRFDHIGVFPFSFETGTPSSPYGDPVPEELKLERRDQLMEAQQEISLQIHQSLVGCTLDVLIEGSDKNTVMGRSYRDAPEVDGLVIAEGKASVGDLIPVQIQKAMPYDLFGEISAHSTDG